MQEIYISTDVKADGPIPGQNSMLSFGCAAYLKNKELISTFEVWTVEDKKSQSASVTRKP